RLSLHCAFHVHGGAGFGFLDKWPAGSEIRRCAPRFRLAILCSDRAIDRDFRAVGATSIAFGPTALAASRSVFVFRLLSRVRDMACVDPCAMVCLHGRDHPNRHAGYPPTPLAGVTARLQLSLSS